MFVGTNRSRSWLLLWSRSEADQKSRSYLSIASRILLFRKYIEAMLATYIEKEGVQVKLVTIQYANDVFSHTNVATR